MAIQDLMAQAGNEIKEMPGEVASFAKRVPGMIGSLPGRMAGGARKTFGFEDSGLPKEHELFGMNPRRAYWANALSDLGNATRRGGRDPNTRMQGNQMQQQFVQSIQQRKQLDQYRDQMAQAALLNAKKPRGSTKTSAMKHAEAIGLEPGSPEYNEYIRNYDAKSGVNINMGPKVGTAFYSDIMKDAPAKRELALKAQQDLARYNVMETLMPYMGKTGVGKEMMTSFRSGLNQFGMEHYGKLMDSFAKAGGIDLFSGDQGVNELFRALSTGDIIGQARELYPVSNTDINLLKEMVATLRINDPDAMGILIQRGKQQAQLPITTYNDYRGYMENAPEDVRNALPPLPALPETPILDVDSLIPSDRTGISQEEYDDILRRFKAVREARGE